MLNTGATSFVLDPSILPSQFWTQHYKAFETVNRDVFETHYLSKRLFLQFFPTHQIGHKMIGTSAPGRDAIIGWDVIVQLWKHKVRALPNGLQFQSFFLPYVAPNNLCSFDLVSIQQKL